MPVVVETNFHQQPTAASLMAVSPGVVVGAPESAPIALMEVSSRSVVEEGNPGRLVFSSGGSREPTAANPVDTTFTNGAGNSTDTGTPHPVSPWNGTRPREHSRSPSLGDTFVSAAASSDLPYPSSSSPSDSSDDSAAEEAEMLDVSVTRSAFGYITTATITLSGSHSSLDAKDVIGSEPNQPEGRSFADNGNSAVIPTVSSDTEQAGTFLSPGHAPSPSSESTSISMSIGSVGEDSTVRDLNEPHVSVKIITEKKGLFLKHSEYEIKLKGAEKPVRRRYKDFVTLHGYLAEKYPYRLLPTLPPKQLMLDALLEERRRGLQTWLTIVSLHPVLGSTTIVGTFLRDATTDYQYRLRVAYEKQMDEYARLRPDVQLPGEDMDALVEARTRMRRVQADICRLKELFDDHTFRNEQQLSERTEIADILKNDGMRKSFPDGTFEHMSTSMRLASRRCEHNVRVQQRVITERLHVLLEVLHAHSTLCERIERGIFAEHQKARLKLASTDSSTNSRTKTITATNNHGPLMMPPDGFVTSSDLTVLARRSAFALSCARGETELTERYLDSLPSILLSYAHQEQQHHQQMSKIWNRLIVSESSRVH